MVDEDIQFFTDHRDRYARIRKPKMVLTRSPQRAMYYRPEYEGEFWSLGEHNKDRRRILVWRAPESHPDYDPKSVKILRIPFLLFADETIEDTDAVLLPIIHQIMTEKAKQFGFSI
jgi:hypothetical protein